MSGSVSRSTSIAGPCSRTRSGGPRHPDAPSPPGRSTRAAQRHNPLGHPHQPPGQPLVLDGGGLADLPGRLGASVPELEAPFVVVDLACRQVERFVTGEVLRPVLRRCGLQCIRASTPGRHERRRSRRIGSKDLSRGGGIGEWLCHESLPVSRAAAPWRLGRRMTRLRAEPAVDGCCVEARTRNRGLNGAANSVRSVTRPLPRQPRPRSLRLNGVANSARSVTSV